MKRGRKKQDFRFIESKAASNPPRSGQLKETASPCKQPASRLSTARTEFVIARQAAYFDSVQDWKGPSAAQQEALACLTGVLQWLANSIGPRRTYEVVQGFADWSGERGIVLCIAPNIDQATIVLDYITANFQPSPILQQWSSSAHAGR